MKGFALDTLDLHNLRHTSCREEVLNIFSGNEGALSHGDVEEPLKKRFDRVTIYRTLKTFTDKGILHKVLDEDGLRYALCKEACSEHHHQHDHVHFKCHSCGKTICLDEVHIPHFALPMGFELQEMSLLIQGVCKDC